MSIIATKNLIAQNNTTFEEVLFNVAINGVPLNLTGAVIEMQIRKDGCSTPVLSLTSVANAGISITDASAGDFKINKQVLNIKPCNYKYDIKIILSSGIIKRYIGGAFQVVEVITK